MRDWLRDLLVPARRCFVAYHDTGIPFKISASGTIHGACGCGWRFAARSHCAAVAGVLDHLSYGATR